MRVISDRPHWDKRCDLEKINIFTAATALKHNIKSTPYVLLVDAGTSACLGLAQNVREWQMLLAAICEA
jgi:hypothetical protein